MGAREWRVICIEGGGEGEQRGRGSARWRRHEGRPWARPSGVPLCLPRPLSPLRSPFSLRNGAIPPSHPLSHCLAPPQRFPQRVLSKSPHYSNRPPPYSLLHGKGLSPRPVSL